MTVLISQKKIIDKYGQICDVLENSYLGWIKKYFVDDMILPVPNIPEMVHSMCDVTKPVCIIFSGGNNLSQEFLAESINLGDTYIDRDLTEQRLFDYACKKGIPILGICRGAQMINILLNGHLSCYIDGHDARKKHECVYKKNKYTINSYHKHGMYHNDLSDRLKPIIILKDGIVEAYAGKVDKTKILGLQWHPERSDSDSQLVSLLMNQYVNSESLQYTK